MNNKIEIKKIVKQIFKYKIYIKLVFNFKHAIV